MTFDELRLACAVHRSNLGGRDYISDADRLEVTRRVFEVFSEIYQDTYFPWRVDDVVRLHMNLRKNRDTRTKVEIALAHGSAECFWQHRDKGPCSDEAEAGHLVPNCQGGPLTVQNCIIECRAHNNQRRERTIEQYIAEATLNTHRESKP